MRVYGSYESYSLEFNYDIKGGHDMYERHVNGYKWSYHDGIMSDD